MPNRYLKGIFFLSLFSASHALLALAQNPDPIEIQSDRVIFDQRSRSATHEGHVVLKQNNHLLHADKVIIQKDSHGNLSVLTAIGNPATFEGQVKEAKSPMKGSANTIHYHPAQHLVILEGKAKLEQPPDSFQGPILHYQMDKQVVTASKSNHERPTIVFHPKTQ